MWDRGEVVAQISVHHLLSPVLRHMPEDSTDGHFGIESGTKSILLWQQVRLEDRPDHQHHRHLDHTVADRRDAERSLASVALRYPYTQKGLGAYVPATQLLPQLPQPSLYSVVLDLLEGLPVHSRRPALARQRR